MSETPISPLRARMIEDMSVRKFADKTQDDYIRHVKSFSTFLARSPAKATPEDLRRFQVHQSKAGAQPPTNWDDVFATLDKLKAAGLVPLAFSGTKVWERNLFNAVLVGKGALVRSAHRVEGIDLAG